jgi:hypothetical protein
MTSEPNPNAFCRELNFPAPVHDNHQVYKFGGISLMKYREENGLIGLQCVGRKQAKYREP